ncbi:MAG: PSD1 and planctomycete cytochrome C domain-containing protein [Acidobacteriota bacterium]
MNDTQRINDRTVPRGTSWALVLMAVCVPAWAQNAADPSYFTQKVEPILTSRCLGCHNQKLSLASFSMASRESLIKGGKRGPEVVPGKPAESRLIDVVKHTGDLRMPPGKKLPDAEIAILESWVAAGAAWGSSTTAQPPPKPNHWSFVAPQRPELPVVKNAAWTRTPVDRFILARLEKEGIAPAAEAQRATLIRRVYLDLTGLLPTPEEISAFEKDTRPDAWERVVDQLLASPHYGERWGRHWLDLARYADSDGGSRDEPRQIWRYRDWVINALNADKPFDQFVIEQLAGDLLPNATRDQLVATGFHRNAMLQIEAGTDREQYRTEAVFDRVDTTGTVFLGLSVGCARCHDHKFDPISHREYYSLFAFFNSSDDWGNDRPRFQISPSNLYEVHRPLLYYSTDEEVARRDDLMARMNAIIESLDKTGQDAAAAADTKQKREELKTLQKQLPNLEWTMIMQELPQPRETHILLSGDYLQKGEAVQPGVPAFLNALPTVEKPNRLDFAKWLTSPANPLLARVTVNRIWQQYFGRGIVETENDFGTQGTPPTHPELLDWLATEFVRSGWSEKAIHRLILTSAVYRQSSNERPELSLADPRNLLLARQARIRLDAEIVRDSALVASGMLVPHVGGPSVFPPQPAKAMDASQVAKTWTTSVGEDRYRRGIYTFFWRITPNPALVVFDAPSSMTTCTRRDRSNTPLQALALLNQTTFHEFAQGFARRLLQDVPSSSEQRLLRAFQLTTARAPSPPELQKVRAFLNAERDSLSAQPDEVQQLVGPAAPPNLDKVELAVWTSLARALFNTDEFITRE